MKQNNKRFTSMILALLLLVGALIVYFDFTAPAYSQLQNEKGQELSEQNLLENEQQIVTQVQSLVSSYQSETQGQQSVTLALPVGQNEAGALAAIYGIAANDGMSIQSIGVTSNAPQVQNSTPASGAGLSGAASAGNIVKPLGSISFSVTAAGTYESMKSFLSHIETNTRVMNVSAISVHPANLVVVKGAPVSQDFFNFAFTITAYYQSP